MTDATWQDECHRAAALFESKDYAGAEKVFDAICARPDVGQSDKAMMYLNLARVRETMGHIDGALKAFDGARIEALQYYLYVQQTKAVFLVNAKRFGEAITLIEELLKSDALNADGRDACTSNLAIARQFASGKAPPAGVPSEVKFTEAPRASL